jgi:S1-C subfamily serine protease
MRSCRSVRFKSFVVACLLPILLSQHVLAAYDRPWIGMDIEDCRLGSTFLGIFVAHVEESSPASAAGIAPGDVVVSLEGIALAGSDDLICKVFVLTPGHRVSLGVLRDGNHHLFAVPLAMWPLNIPQPSRSCVVPVS